jgi:preprotein translocase subunit SecE
MDIIGYLRDARGELKHVSWPTRSQAINYTVLVLAISIGTGIFLGILDFLFSRVISRFI